MRYTTLRRAAAGGLAVAAGLSLAAPAAAQRQGGMFQRADQNGDGKVTVEEVTAFAEGRVEMLDNDGDQAFTEDDLRGWIDNQLATATARRFQRFDPNGDGKITQSEFQQRMQNKERAQRVFKRYDANGDGTIVPDEMTRVTRDMIKRRRKQQRQQSQSGKDQVGRSFSALDSDGDGTVTRKEAVARAKRLFEQRDSNGDGVITQQEMRRRQGQGGQGSGQGGQQ